MHYEINEQLAAVIKSSSFCVAEGVYVYAKIKAIQNIEKHLMITQDDDEITVLTQESNLSEVGEYERNPDNWKLLIITCGNPFYCVGFLAAISSVFAGENIDVTLTSTYSKDYVLVQEKNFKRSIALLSAIGFSQHSV